MTNGILSGKSGKAAEGVIGFFYSFYASCILFTSLWPNNDW